MFSPLLHCSYALSCDRCSAVLEAHPGFEGWTDDSDRTEPRALDLSDGLSDSETCSTSSLSPSSLSCEHNCDPHRLYTLRSCRMQIPPLENSLSLELLVSGPCKMPTQRYEEYVKGATRDSDLLHKAGLMHMRKAVPVSLISLLDEEAVERIDVIFHSLALKGLVPKKTSSSWFIPDTKKIENLYFREMSNRHSNRFDIILYEIEVDMICLRQMQMQIKLPPIHSLALNASWLPLIRKRLLLGTTADQDSSTFTLKCSVSVVFSWPGAEDQSWHADGPHLSHLQETGCYGICVFLPLMSLETNGSDKEKVGCTQFYPGSHLEQKLIGLGGACLPLGCAWDGTVGLGDAVLYDYRLLHRGKANCSENVERRILQFFYYRSDLYKEGRNYNNNESVF